VKLVAVSRDQESQERHSPAVILRLPMRSGVVGRRERDWIGKGKNQDVASAVMEDEDQEARLIEVEEDALRVTKDWVSAMIAPQVCVCEREK